MFASDAMPSMALRKYNFYNAIVANNFQKITHEPAEDGGEKGLPKRPRKPISEQKVSIQTLQLLQLQLSGFR
jgi:hypothetical protein